MGPGHFSFLHAADLHIDSPLRGLQSYPGCPAEEIRLAARAAFSALVDQAIARRVNFVLLAGDLFDGEWKSYDTGLWFLSQLGRLGEADIQVYVIRGNHDAESVVSRKLPWPKHVHSFPESKPDTVRIEELGVAIHGQGYADRAVLDNLSLGYPDSVPGLFNIGILHTSLAGDPDHEPYAPCTAADLKARGYDYWALGHIHGRNVVAEDPWIVFPGNLQGRHARELGAKGATLVEVQGGKVASVDALEFDVVRWDHVKVNLGGAMDEATLEARVDEALADAAAAAGGRLVACRVTLVGATALDHTLQLDRERIDAQIRAQGDALETGRMWVEKVRIETTRELDLEADGDFAGLAQALDEASLDLSALGTLAADLGTLASRLPADARGGLDPKDLDARVEFLRKHLPDARRYLGALLAGDGGSSA